MSKRSVKTDWIASIALLIGPVIGISFGLIASGWISDRKLADKPYVDERFVEGKRYTDDKSESVLEKAIEHSDTNRQQILLKMEQMNTDYRTSNATLAAKLDGVYELVRTIRDDISPRKHK